MTAEPHLPPEIRHDLQRARRVEWWTLGFLVSIVATMYLVLGSSQAMKTAWLEDMLSLLPPALFLLATKLEERGPTEHYPYGFHRAGSLAFFASACALTVMGAWLFYEAARTLAAAEHATIGNVRVLGHQVWLGWLMIAALVYSVIPPMILGHMKKRLAKRLNDKLLWTDAETNAADWRTGLAGALGVTGIAFGIWWADAAAAGLISLSILRDGLQTARMATAVLIDGAPRNLTDSEISDEVRMLRARLTDRYPATEVRIRETGRYMRVLLVPKDPGSVELCARTLEVGELSWRVAEFSRTVETVKEPAR